MSDARKSEPSTLICWRRPECCLTPILDVFAKPGRVGNAALSGRSRQSIGTFERWDLWLPGASSAGRNKRLCRLINRDLVRRGVTGSGS